MNQRSSARYRLVMFAISTLLFIPLGLALWLTPAASGMGTHQQLGLPPCTMRLLFGIRCPGCGMTTSWAWLVRGQVWMSLQTNAAGTFFALLDAGAAFSFAYFAWTGKHPTDRWLKVIAVCLCLGMAQAIAIWSWRLYGGD